MENPLEVIKNSPAIVELMKTKEGRSLAERLFRLSGELNLMPDTVKSRFKNELGSAFESSLDPLLMQPDQQTEESLEGWSQHCFIIFVIFLFASKLIEIQIFFRLA